jgi:hypothetical protein
MSQMFSRIEPALQEFIERQRIFFTGSATADSRVNVSPKGSDSLRVIGPNAVAYLDQTGSGNEAAAHLRKDGRLTIMFCAFEGPPMILRLYGRGRSLVPNTRSCWLMRSVARNRRVRGRSCCWMSRRCRPRAVIPCRCTNSRKTVRH